MHCKQLPPFMWAHQAAKANKNILLVLRAIKLHLNYGDPDRVFFRVCEILKERNLPVPSPTESPWPSRDMNTCHLSDICHSSVTLLHHTGSLKWNFQESLLRKIWWPFRPIGFKSLAHGPLTVHKHLHSIRHFIEYYTHVCTFMCARTPNPTQAITQWCCSVYMNMQGGEHATSFPPHNCPCRWGRETIWRRKALLLLENLSTQLGILVSRVPDHVGQWFPNYMSQYPGVYHQTQPGVPWNPLILPLSLLSPSPKYYIVGWSTYFQFVWCLHMVGRGNPGPVLSKDWVSCPPVHKGDIPLLPPNVASPFH